MSNHPKRVLVVGMTDNPGGIEALVMNTIASVDPDRIRFDILANSEALAFEDRLKEYGAAIHRITARRRSRARFYRDLDDVLRRTAGAYDAVWENMNTLGNIDYLIHAKRYGIPVRIIHCHNSGNCDGFVRGVLHKGNRLRIRRYATHYWSVSDEASAWFYGRDFRRLPNYRVITNAIDSARFAYDAAARREIRAKLGIPSSAVVVGNVGRVQRQKNQIEILETLGALTERGVDAHALIVGGGELRDELFSRSKSLGLDGRLHITGRVEDSAPFYSAMDVFMFPSLHEGLSIALLEAQANGLPLLLSDRILLDGVVTGQVETLPLELPSSIWADGVVSLLNAKSDRSDAIRGSRFDSSNLKGLFDDIL